MKVDQKLFQSLFRIGEVIQSGGPAGRANSAQLRILAIEPHFFRYQSVKSQSPKQFPYSYIQVVLDGFDRIDPKAIQRTIQPVLLDAGLEENLWTENYAYGFARAIRERLQSEPQF